MAEVLTFMHILWLLAGMAAGFALSRWFWKNSVIPEPKLPSREEQDGAPRLASGLIATLPVPALAIDADGIILASNPAANRAFGTLSEGTLLYLKFRAPEMRIAVEQALAAGENTSFEMVERLPVEQWYRVDLCQLPQEDSLKTRIALFFRDQSESHKLDRMRSDFVANASHELRTPLASMTGFIETLKGPARNDAAARDKFLTIMLQQAERMARLIDDLLSLSRLEMRPIVPLEKTVDLQLTVDYVIDAMRPLGVELGVMIEKNYDAGPFMVPGVRDELIQVVENLLENACKYGQQGKKVLVSLANSPGEVRLSVRDFGPGIAADHIPRLTERFYRVDPGTSRAQKGTGLGLAIVKHILTRHHARLSIQSERGEGSDFIVNFPTPDTSAYSAATEKNT